MTAKTLLVSGVALFLGGCGHTNSVVQLPDGRTGHSIDCRKVSECMNEAAKVCGGPYEVIESDTRTKSGSPGFPMTKQVYNHSTGKYDTVAVQVGATGGSSRKELVFACGAPAAGAKPPP